MMNINSIGNPDISQRQMQSSGMGKEQINDSVTKEIQTKLQGEEQKLKDLSYNDAMSVQEKSKKQKEIRKEISELNRELRQRQIELQREKQQKAKEAAQEEAREVKDAPKEEVAKKHGLETNEHNAGEETVGLSTVRMNAMLSAEAGMGRADVQTNVAMNMEHRVNVLEVEIQQDKARGQDVEFKEAQKKELENIVIGSKASGTGILNDVNKELEKLVEEEAKDKKKGSVKLQEIQEEQEERRKRIRVVIDS